MASSVSTPPSVAADSLAASIASLSQRMAELRQYAEEKLAAMGRASASSPIRPSAPSASPTPSTTSTPTAPPTPVPSAPAASSAAPVLLFGVPIGFTSAASASPTPSASASPTPSATSTPTAPSAPAASSGAPVLLFGVPIGFTSAASASPTPPAAPTRAVPSTAAASAAALSPPRAAAAIFFRLPTPDYLTAKKKIAKKSVRALLSLAVGQEASLSTRACRTSVFPIRTKPARVECPSERKKALTTPRSKVVRSHRRPPRRGRPPRLRVQGLGMRPRPRRRALRHGIRRPRRRRRNHRRSERASTPSRACAGRPPRVRAQRSTMEKMGLSTTVPTTRRASWRDMDGSGDVNERGGRSCGHTHQRPRRPRPHRLPWLRAHHHHHTVRGGLPQGTPGRHPRHHRWELRVHATCVQTHASITRGLRDARRRNTTARSSSTATPTAARTPPTPMPLQYKSSVLVVSAWSKPAAVSMEALEVFDGMSCRYISTLQPSQLIKVLLLGCATNFHEDRKQFEEMVEPLDHVVWSVPTSEMSRPLIYSMTQYMMRFLCWEIGNGVVGSWFQQAQLTIGFLLEASPWLVMKMSLAVSKLTHIQSQSWPRQQTKSILSTVSAESCYGEYTNFIQLLLKTRANPNIFDELRRLSMEIVELCECKEEEELQLPFTLLIPNDRKWSVAGVHSHAKSDNTKLLDKMHFAGRRTMIKSQVDLAFRQKECAMSFKFYNLGIDIEPEAILILYSKRSLCKLRMGASEGALSDANQFSQSDVLVLLTISWPPPALSGSSVLETIQPFLNLHEFWQQRQVHLQFTGLPSLCISELKPWPPRTGMRNELLQVDRTSAQNTINLTAMFVWRQEWCGLQNNCYYLEQILGWCLLLCTAKGRCWKVASSWQCKTSNQEQVLAEISDCRGDKQAVNEFHFLGSEYCSTILEHLIFIFLDMTENSSVKDNSNPLPNTAYASALLIKQQEQLLHQQYKWGNSQRLQRQQHGQQLYIKGAAMVVDDDMPPVKRLRTRCQLSKLDVAFWLQGDAGRDGNAPPVIAVLACPHACYSKLQFYNLMIEDP